MKLWVVVVDWKVEFFRLWGGSRQFWTIFFENQITNKNVEQAEGLQFTAQVLQYQMNRLSN